MSLKAVKKPSTQQVAQKPTGFSRSFFTTIEIPCTLENAQEAGGVWSNIEAKLLFRFRREKLSDSESLTMSQVVASALGIDVTQELLFNRFCFLLSEIPVGFNDFPTDESIPLEERAREYFGHDCFELMIRAVMLQYGNRLIPKELFKG